MIVNVNPIFTEPRKDTDLDVISTVRDLLNVSGLAQESNTRYDNDHDILYGANLGSKAQIFMLNRFWLRELIAIKPNTIEERLCLINDIEPVDWLRLFKEKILPCAIENRLPKLITSGGLNG